MTRRAPPPFAAIAIAVVFATATIAVGTIRYRIFRTQVDLGLFTQVIASPRTFSSTAEGGVNHLAVHFSPILSICSPVLALARTPLALIVAQDLLSALALPAVYLLARRRMPERPAILVTMLCCAYPPFVAMTVGDFYELAFATPVLLWLAWALDTGRMRLATALAFVALLVKEDVTLVLAAVAASVWLHARRRDARLARFAAALAAAAAAVTIGYFGALRPSLSPTGTHAIAYRLYDWSPRATPPGDVADARSPVRVAYLAGAFGPLVALPLLEPAVVLAVPGFLEVLASHEAVTIDLSTHYVACWLPYLWFALVLGVARFARRSGALASVALACGLVGSLWIDAFASPAHFWYSVYRLPSARDARVERLLESLPHDASIASDLWLFAHLGLHPRATIDPTNAEFVVVDRRCDTAYCTQKLFPFVAASLARGTLRDISTDDGIELYRSATR